MNHANQLVGNFKVLCLALPVILSACETTDKHVPILPFGPTAPTINRALNLKPENKDPRASWETVRTAVWSELNIGNKTPDDKTPITPSDYTAAGYNYVDRQCSTYFDQLIQLQHKTAFGGDLVAASGSATAAIMGLAKASSMAIGIVAAGFGLASATVIAFDKRALLTPYPDETKTLIMESLGTYRTAYPPNTMRTPAEAITNVQRYAEVCTYSGISRAAKQALASSKPAINPNTTEATMLGTAIAAKLGLAAPLDDGQAVALFWLLNKGGSPCTPEAKCQAAVKKLPAALQPKVYDSTAKKYPDLGSIKNSVGSELDRLYAISAEFKALVDAFPGDAPAPAKTEPTKASKPAGKATVATAGATIKQSSLTDRYSFSLPPGAFANGLTTERFGQLYYPGPRTNQGAGTTAPTSDAAPQSATGQPKK